MSTDDERRRARRRNYLNDRNSQIARGVWEPHVDPALAREHLLYLIDRGNTRQLVSERAGVSLWVIQRILNGKSKKIRVDTADAILGVPDMMVKPRGARVNPVGSRRRAGAMAAMGWTLDYQARRVKLKVVNYRLIFERTYLFAGTHDRIKDLYAELWDQRGASLEARTWAYHQGWPPPMCWDDDELDNPDPRVHQRALARTQELRVAWEDE